jgi:PAS domain S-box-containing protein
MTVSVRTKLLGLLLFLMIILVSSGYLLQTIMDDSLRIIEKQTATIQTLQATTKAGKIYTNLRWTYLTFLSKPTKDNLANLESKLQEFDNSIAPMKIPMLTEEVAKIANLTAGLKTTAEDTVKIKPDSEQRAIFENEASKRLSEVDETLDAIVVKLEQFLTRTAASTREHTDTLHSIPAMFIIGGFLTLLFATVVSVLQLFVPISKITRSMTSASIDTANAKNYILPVPRHDELGMATEALNSLLIEVSEGIERISTAERKLRDTGQYLQAIMDNVVDGVITLNEIGRIETFSPSAERLFQRSSREAIGAHISTLLFDNRGTPFDLVAQVAEKPLDFFTLSPSELQARSKNGVMVPVELAVGQTGFAGRTMYVATLRDISARKQMENFLEQAQRMETVGRMTGGIAHDFNNMLTVISGNFELIQMKMKEQDPILKSMVSMGLETVRRGKDMTQRLLAISSRQLLKPEVIHFPERLPAIVEMIRRAVREDVEITTNLPAEEWNIRVDPVQFESALLNLAINARDALPAQGGRIIINVSNTSLNPEKSAGIRNVKPGEYVEVAVIDNGKGIPAAIIDRVLEPFFTTKPGDKGTGLGLSMVYGFTRQSGGYVRIESTEGSGTVIRLFFPRSMEAFEVSALRSEERTEAIPTGNESLLIVEDRPDVLKYVTQTLRELGYRVTSAPDAQTALKKLQKRKNLDMLLTDVVMPGEMNGEDLAQEAVKQLPHLKVLYMSGYTRDALQEQGSLKQGVHLLAKPFTRADLAWHVRKVLDAA